MKKSLIFKILYLFLGLVVMAGASVFATNTYLASQVSYGNTNVETALNDLYKLKGNNNIYTFDTTNLIYTICNETDWVSNTSFSYTATQNCYILGELAGINYGNVCIKVNDITIGFFQGESSEHVPINYLIKSGDKIEFISTGQTSKKICVYGIK